VIVTNRDGKVRFLNAEAERMTGWEWQDAKDKPLRAIFRIVNEETRNSVDDPVEKVFRENRVVGLANHTLLISKRGTEWPIEDSAAPILDSNKEIIGVVLVFHDATALRRASQVLKLHADDLEKKVVERTIELHRTVTDLQAFSYTISHDLRAPLRSMKGFAEVLLQDHGHKMDEEAVSYLNRISNAADRLDILIRDILAYSQVSSANQPIHAVDLTTVVKEVILQYPGIKEREREILVQEPLDSVMGHEAPLTQIVSNLLSNALKFAHPERTPLIRIRTEAHATSVKLWIEDNGIGIPSNHFERIFEMFQQVHPNLKPGTGIGLAIVKKAAEKIHASVGVESTLGEGSKFWVELLRPKLS
ncbi:MAG TPA: ATP-binding protein, partial [Opitutaceae bacterium]